MKSFIRAFQQYVHVNDEENRWTLPDWSSALLWTRARNSGGIKVVLDILGEFTTNKSEMEDAKKAYLHLIDTVSNEGINASITVKASALGSTFDKITCASHISEIAEKSNARKVGFELDMEGRSLVDFTLEVAVACRNAGYPVTLALQAYLDRTPRDLDKAMASGIRVRLVKGAYVGDLTDFIKIQDRFKSLTATLIDSGASFCIGTHDPELIDWTAGKLAESKERIEFGMLKGLSDSTKLDLVGKRWIVSEYVPFGKNKVAYESRRKAYLRTLKNVNRQPAP